MLLGLERESVCLGEREIFFVCFGCGPERDFCCIRNDETKTKAFRRLQKLFSHGAPSVGIDVVSYRPVLSNVFCIYLQELGLRAQCDQREA